ncbi:general negative regulator of transcription subunit 1 [Trichomonascus vanleenenianus]|uniref:CCR4-NOT core subunit CDC39 n=1 Tax=Trichomonascus vanleenenianus TaxID=2268995 RepID=UPI003ECA6520
MARLEGLAGALESLKGDFSKASAAVTNCAVNAKELAAVAIVLTVKTDWDGSAAGTLVQKTFPSELKAIKWTEDFVPNLDTIINDYEISFKKDDGTLNLLKFLLAIVSKDRIKDVLTALFSYKWKKNDTASQLAVTCTSLGLNGRFDFRTATELTPLYTMEMANTQPTLSPEAEQLVDANSKHVLNCKELMQLVVKQVGYINSSGKSPIKSLMSHDQGNWDMFLAAGLLLPPHERESVKDVVRERFDTIVRELSARTTVVLLGAARGDKNFVVNELVDLAERDGSVVPGLAMIAYETGLLEPLLYSKHYTVSLDLAAQADKKNLVVFESFLEKSVAAFGLEFIIALLDFLEVRATAEYTQSEQGQPPTGMNLKSVAAALRMISGFEMSPDRLEQVRAIQIQCLQLYPRLINFGQGHDQAILSHGDSNLFSEEVESEMKMYYQKMYAQQMEIRDIITMLQKLKQSDVPKDQDVFACMVHSLFDEYRFFPEYPLTALATTAVLFGSLVYFQLIDGIPLSIALRYILDSLKNPPDSNMFKFGLQALFEFRNRLNEFPKYCALLLEIPGLQSHQQFYNQIKEVVAMNKEGGGGGGGGIPPPQLSLHHMPGGPPPPVVPPTGAVPPGMQATATPPTRGTDQGDGYKSVSDFVLIDDTPQEQPNESISDRVLFAVNNIAQNNVEEKTQELRGLLEPKYYQWFASYIVGERSKLEPNYHRLYINMLTRLNSKMLENYCVKVTYSLIIKLLNNPNTKDNAEPRKHLKHLGQWLGNLLLARDRPILHRNIFFKGLLYEGYQKGELAVIIPFVCRTLEWSKDSTVFWPPNPWTLGIIKVLVELYHTADLKLNHKFEIEVLLKNFDMTVDDVEMSTYIKDRERGGGDVGRQNEDLSLEMERLQLGGTAAVGVESLGLGGEVPAATGGMFTDAFYATAVGQIAFNGNSIFTTHPAVRRMLQIAAERALREILQPVVERAVTIAVVTTKELVLKDFALEPNEQKMREAAQNVVRVLAGNLSAASSKEPLKESLANHLRTIVSSSGYADNAMLLEQIPLVIADNVDALCSLVEKSAVDRALVEVEEVLSPSYRIRANHRQSRSHQVFVDPQAPASRFPAQLPDPFRLHPGGLLPQQWSIYENFGNLQYHQEPKEGSSELVAAEVQGDTGAMEELRRQQAQSQAPSQGAADQPPVMSPQSQAAQQGIDANMLAMQNLIELLEKAIAESKETSFTELTAEHKVSQIMTQILTTAQRSPMRDQLVLRTSQITVSLLFTATDSQLGREVLCFMLDRLCEYSAATAKEVVLWLIYSDDERKYNVPVMVTLLRAKLITATEMDVNLAKQVLSKNEAAIKFAAGLMHEAVLGKSPCALRTEFTGCLDAMELLAKEDPPNKLATGILAALEKSNARALRFESFDLASLNNEPTKKSSDESKEEEGGEMSLNDQMGYIFAEWIRLIQHPCRTERNTHLFVYQLFQHGILSNANLLATFVRTAVNIGVANAKALSPQHSETFVAVDALAKLLVTILVTSSSNSSVRSDYIKRVLTVVNLVLAKDHEGAAEEFNAQPYFRLYSTLLYELTTVDLDDEFYDQAYLRLSDAFMSLQPLAFPGFTFAWMSLISHRMFLPRLMNLEDNKGWKHVASLLEAMIRCIGLYATDKLFPESIAVMYKGALRIFLVILHDYPAFLIEYHYTLCNVIPPSFVQLRNVVLSAFPEEMELPDPLTQGLKVDRLPAVQQVPVVAADPGKDLQEFGLRKLVDNYLSSPSPAIIKGMVPGFNLAKPVNVGGVGFDKVSVNVAALNALVLYIGMEAVDDKPDSSSKDKKNTTEEDQALFKRDSVHLSLITQLMAELSVEGRYFLCEAMANQLRYPNRHTHFYSCVLLSLFGNHGSAALGDKKLDVQHLITRVLLERIICNRPHPWGLMITFTELLKNQAYKFWELPFTKAIPDIERMFASLYEHISSNSRTENGQPVQQRDNQPQQSAAAA